MPAITYTSVLEIPPCSRDREGGHLFSSVSAATPVNWLVRLACRRCGMVVTHDLRRTPAPKTDQNGAPAAED